MAKRKRHGFVSFIGIKAERKCSVFSLTAADLTTLHSAPVTLILAPSKANRLILVEGAVFEFQYNTTQFTGGGAVQLVYHGATANLLTGTVVAATIQAAASSQTSMGVAAAGLALSPQTAVDLYAATADFAAGDATATVTIFYTEIELGN